MLVQVLVQVNDYLRQTLKAKNSLASFAERMKTAAGADPNHAETLVQIQI